MKDPPAKEFQTIALQESNMTNGYQQDGFQETNFADFDQASYQNQAGAPPAAPNQNSNPFKSQAPNNPFRN
jgi:hypothetical protein